jgi:prepilin peptidase CpaA
MTDPFISHLLLVVAAATALLFAAANDVALRIVPNRTTCVVALAGIGLNWLDGQLIAALFGTALVFAALWCCWRNGWFGGGDVKLLTACSLLVPPFAVPELILTTAIFGGLLALAYLVLGPFLPPLTQHRSRNVLTRVWRAECRRIRRRLSLPYACAIAAGALFTLSSPIGLP